MTMACIAIRAVRVVGAAGGVSSWSEPTKIPREASRRQSEGRRIQA